MSEQENIEEDMMAELEQQHIPTFILPTAEEKEYIDDMSQEIIKSNFFGEKNVASARIKVRACLSLKIDPVLFYAHIQIMDFAGKKVITQSAYLMSYLILRSFPNAIQKQGWVGQGEALKFNILVQRPGRPVSPFSFSLKEGKHAGYHLRNKNWEKVPKDMVRSRCVSRMARTEFPDVLGGIIYTPADFDEVERVDDE